MKELRVYSRKQKTLKEKEDHKQPKLHLEPELSLEICPGNSDSELNTFENIDDLNLPIAVRKGTRACTQHPIGKFVSHEKLLSNFRAFTIALTYDARTLH